VDAVAAGLIGIFFEWRWSPVVVLFGMFCVWVEATVRAPYKQRDEARALLKYRTKPLPNRAKLVEAIAEAKIAVVEYLEFYKGLKVSKQGCYTVDIDSASALDKVQERYKVALESMGKQIIVAGSDYEGLTKPLLSLMQSGKAILDTPTAKLADSILTFKSHLDKSIKQAVANIDILNQQASHKETC